VNAGAIAGRCVPDIAANADWNASPYLLVVDGQSQGNGGTSAASPLIASLLTLINQARATAGKGRVGFLTPELYQSSTGGQPAGQAGCTDVTSGNNDTATDGGYSAGAGYDAASGWGTPNGVNLAQALP
jgi:kumamolisin